MSKIKTDCEKSDEALFRLQDKAEKLLRDYHILLGHCVDSIGIPKKPTVKQLRMAIDRANKFETYLKRNGEVIDKNMENLIENIGFIKHTAKTTKTTKP